MSVFLSFPCCSARDSFDKDAARLLALAEAGKKRGRPDQPVAKRTREVVWARGTGYGSGNEKGGALASGGSFGDGSGAHFCGWRRASGSGLRSLLMCAYRSGGYRK